MRLVGGHGAEDVVHQGYCLGDTGVIDRTGEVEQHDVIILFAGLDYRPCSVKRVFRFCNQYGIRGLSVCVRAAP